MRKAGLCLFRVVLSALFPITLFSGCGGSGGSSSTPPPAQSTITSVTVSPSTATVQPNATQTFQSTVTGTGSYSSLVQWSVGGIAGGNAKLGTISSAGLYTAPSSPPNPNTVTVAATSTQDSTKSGSSQTQIGSQPFDITGVQLSPMKATVNTGWSQQFTAIVEGTGTFDPSISFSVNGVSGGNSVVGTIDSHGLYTSPATLPQPSAVSITAASVAAPGVSTSASVTLAQSTTDTPVISQLVPSTADAEQQIQILGTGFNAGGQTTSTTIVVFTGPNGLSIPVELFGGSNDDQERDVAVPLGAADGPVYVIVQDSFGPAIQSNTVQFTRTPRIRIRAPQSDLSSGESTTFGWKQLAGAQPITLQWTVDIGSVTSDGVYTAPSSLSADAFAVVKACVQGTTSCDQERLGIHPFRLSPDAPDVASGSSLQLQAIQGVSFISPAWNSAGPGTLSSSGQYAASSQFADAGGIPFTATSGGLTESGTIEVTGQFPGLVNRISDYFDENESHVYGTFPNAVGVANNRLYVNSSYGFYSFALAGDAYPALAGLQDVDVYDISDPSHPVWMDAFEPLTSGKPIFCNGMLYQYAYTDGSYSSGSLTVYDISGNSPVPTQHIFLQPPANPRYRTGAASISGCAIAEFGGTTDDQRTVQAGLNTPLVLHQLQAGGVVDVQYSIPIPSNSSGFANFFGFTSDGKRFFVNLMPADGTANLQLLTYDLTTPTPTLLDAIDTDQLSIDSFQLVGNLLFGTIDTGVYYPRTNVYDVSGNTPQFLAQLPTGYITGASGNNVFATTGNTGPRVIDISNPQKPVLKTALFDYGESIYDEASSGDYLFTATYGSGIGVWDVGKPGGLLPSELIPDDYEAAVPTGIVSNATDMFVTSQAGGASLIRFDLTQSPPKLTSSTFQQNVWPLALALSGSTLYNGTTTALQVFDVSGSGDPTLTTSINVPVAALAVTGSTLLTGTLDNRLIFYDISQPQSPRQIASVNLPAASYQITITGNLALIADDTGGLLIYNIATPAAPALLSQLTQFPEVFGVAIDGNLALLAAREFGLVILDITNPATPTLLGKAEVDTADPFTNYPLMYNKAFAIAVKSKIAWIGIHNLDQSDTPAEGGSEVLGFDYRDPSHPRLVSRNDYGPSYTFVYTLADSPVGLICGCFVSLLALDTTQPLNTIGSFELPEALRSAQEAGSISPSLRAGRGANKAAGTPRSKLAPRLHAPSASGTPHTKAVQPDRTNRGLLP